MNLALRQTTGSITELRQPHVKKQSFPECLYLLERSFDRYGYLKKHGAPDIFVDAEKDLIRRRLLSLCAELTK
jgi:hypothetical protein